MVNACNSNASPVQNGLSNKLLLTFDEASNILSISSSLLRKMARTNVLKVTRIGRCTRISQEEILRLCGGGTLGGVK
jgi:excisionase family DNA binding protein